MHTIATYMQGICVWCVLHVAASWDTCTTVCMQPAPTLHGMAVMTHQDAWGEVLHVAWGQNLL